MTGLEGIEQSKKNGYGQSVQSGMQPMTGLDGIELSKRKIVMVRVFRVGCDQ